MAGRLSVEAVVRDALREDLGYGDVTTASTVAAGTRGSGRIVARQELTLSGLAAAKQAFAFVDPNLEFHAEVAEGDRLAAGTTVARLEGELASVLTGERVALNFLMHLSGVATMTRAFVDAAAGTRAKIVDTRKTTPGMRELQKSAVRHGGGHNHRFRLDDGILIKDNHIRACGGDVGLAVQRAREAAGHLMKVEVEVRNLEELQVGLDAGADVVLLDNMDTETMRKAVGIVDGRALCEASGGMTLGRIAAVAATGVDLISVGALTHSAPSADLALDLD